MVLLPPNIIPSPTSPLTSLRLKKEKNRVWKLGNGLLTALFPHPSLQWALGILEGHGDIFEGSWQGAWKAEEAIRTVGDRHVKHPASQEMSWLLKGLGAWNADDWGEKVLAALCWGGLMKPNRWSACITCEATASSAKLLQLTKTIVKFGVPSYHLQADSKAILAISVIFSPTRRIELKESGEESIPDLNYQGAGVEGGLEVQTTFCLSLQVLWANT